jgi:hypothetical protein
VSEAIRDTIEKLSRVAVLLHLVVVEEELYEPQPLTAAIQRIEDDAEHGLYTVLCHLQIIAGRTSHTDASSAVDAASSLSLNAASRAAYRHLRAYSIFEDASQLLLHLTVRFSALRLRVR